MTTHANTPRWRNVVVSLVVASGFAAGAFALSAHGDGQVDSTRPLLSLGPQGGFADLIEAVQPSVVTVEVSKLTQTGFTGPGFGDPRAQEFFERFFDRRAMPAPPPREAQGVGSGFVIDEAGYVVTNNHVIDGADKVRVVLSDGRRLDAELVGSDPKTDLALLKIDADGLTASRIGDSDRTRVGDWVVAIGNPFGLGGTATVGIVSARGRDLRSGPYDDYLQIDAPINQGNSGGPIFNTDGDVVGVNTAIYSPNGGNVGIAFAIPANMVDDVVQELKAHGVVDRGWLGVQLQDLTDELAESMELTTAAGALVADVVAGSPADQAGLSVGDVIVAIDADPMANARAVSHRVGASDSGDRLKLKVVRRGADKTIKVTLGAAEQPGQVAALPRDAGSMLGLSLAPLSDEYRDRAGLDDAVEGLVVADVAQGSPAAESGLQPGDVLVQANGLPVHSVAEFQQTLQDIRQGGGSRVHVLVKRGQAQQFIALPVA